MTPPANDRRLAFTMIEMILVIVILGIIFSFVAPRMSGLAPKSRLRAFGRRIAAYIEKARVTAIIRGKSTGVRYVLDEEPQKFLFVGPAPADYPDQLVEDRVSRLVEEAPPGVQIRSVVLPDGSSIANGNANIAFSPSGTTGSHIVVLEVDVSGSPQLLALKYNSISGILDYYPHEVQFNHYER